MSGTHAGYAKRVQELVSLFASNGRWQAPNGDNWAVVRDSLAFAVGSEAIEAAGASVDDAGAQSLFVLTATRLLSASFAKQAAAHQVAPVLVRSLSSLVSFEVRTPAAKGSYDLWPAGASVTARFPDAEFHFTPFLEYANSAPSAATCRSIVNVLSTVS